MLRQLTIAETTLQMQQKREFCQVDENDQSSQVICIDDDDD